MKKTVSKQERPVERPASKADARSRLASLAAHLSEISYASSELRFAKQVIGEFLEDKHRSLDHAFGIKSTRGRPKPPPGKHFELARRICEMRRARKSWKRICDELSFPDERKLRAIYGRYHEAIVRHYADKLTARLNGDAKSPELRGREKTTL